MSENFKIIKINHVGHAGFSFNQSCYATVVIQKYFVQELVDLSLLMKKKDWR